MREFASLGSFGTYLGRLALVGHEVTTHVTAEAAKLVQEDAKDRIGDYQDYTGPFKAWEPLADSTLAEKERLGYAPPDNPLLREGALRDSIEVHLDGTVATIGSTDDIALYQEVGTDRGIPPRPFLGPALYSRQHEITELAGMSLMAWLSGRSWRKLASEIKSAVRR